MMTSIPTRCKQTNICLTFRKITTWLGYTQNKRHNSMSAWKISDSLSNSSDLRVSEKLKCLQCKIPSISSPWDVLVRVNATSINPLDVRMTYGYGRRVLDLLDMATNFDVRITNDRYPLTLGRDFSGEVVATGPCASRTYKEGDLVFGVVEPQRSGAHAQYVSVPSYCLTRKSDNLTHLQAASVPFVALTAYSALCTFGHLNRDRCKDKTVLVIGGSGGVGSFAIQLLKLWGARVYATCSGEKTEWLESVLFVDQAIDYNNTSELESLAGRFDFVLDCGDYDSLQKTRDEIVRDSLRFLRPFNNSVYVTLSPPILSNVDRHGLVLGTGETILQAAVDTISGLRNLNSARWAFFLPNKSALEYVARLFSEEAIEPHISSVFGFDQIPEAFEELQSGRVKGKVVIDVLKLNSGQNTEASGQEKADIAN